MKLPLRSIRPASQPSGRFHCSNSGRKMRGSMTTVMHERRLARAPDRDLDRDHGRLQDRAREDVGDLDLAGLDGAALQLDRGRRPARQRLARGPDQVDELLAVLVAEHDPAAGQARRRALGLLAEGRKIVGLQGRRGRQHLRHRDLLVQDARRPRSSACGWRTGWLRAGSRARSRRAARRCPRSAA